MRPLTWVLAGLGGCAYTAEEFQADADAAVCEWKVECFEGTDTSSSDGEEAVDACLMEAEASWDEPGEECDYDQDAAKDCVEQLGYLDCSQYGDVELPEVCDEIWICP